MRAAAYTIAADGSAITCHRCGLTSHNPNDVEHRYCDHCKVFHDSTIPPGPDLLAIYTQIQTFARLCVLVSVADAQAVVEEMERTDAFLPFVDPTAWIKLSKTAPGHQRLARAFLAFRQELAALVESEAL